MAVQRHVLNALDVEISLGVERGGVLVDFAVTLLL